VASGEFEQRGFVFLAINRCQRASARQWPRSQRREYGSMNLFDADAATAAYADDPCAHDGPRKGKGRREGGARRGKIGFMSVDKSIASFIRPSRMWRPARF
jgi:hypothetical protein